MPKTDTVFNDAGWSAWTVARSLPNQRVKALTWFAERPEGVSTFGVGEPSAKMAERLADVGVLTRLPPPVVPGFIVYQINDFGRAVLECLKFSSSDMEVLRRAGLNDLSDKFDLQAKTPDLQRLVDSGFLLPFPRPGKTTQYRITKMGRKHLAQYNK